LEEEDKRKEIWLQNRQIVLKHNYQYDLGQHTYTLGMNNFADMVRIFADMAMPRHYD